MELTNELKDAIDAMSYEQLLTKWRFAPSGEPIFTDVSGDYYKERMAIMRDKHENPSAVSKQIGWK